ncbi:hypothetical protein EMGBS15_15980 [Filimonas sp.]|nr:hypothetical protein EMGBS15_15980 [Filimonas sp.]
MNRRYTLKICIAIFITVLSAFQNLKAQYCMPTYTNYCSPLPSFADYIDNFSTTGAISNITNNGTGCNGSSPNNYIYYSSMTVSQVQGLSFNVSLQSGSTFGQGFRIWVDYNNDFDFADPGEDVYQSGTSGIGVFTGSITIPMLTSPGVKRMRVLCRYNQVPAITDYCGTNFAFGECEDYNLTVIAAAPCTGTPTAGTASASITNPCPGVNVSMGLTGSSFTGGLAYQWLQGSNCTAPWSPISGVTNPTALTPTLVVSSVGGTTIGYRCRITCTNSGLSDTSTSACVVTQPWSCTSPCYGGSSATSAADQDILNVSMGSLNNTTNCTNPLTGSQGTGIGTGSMYADFTGPGGVPSPIIIKGLNTPFSLTIGTCGASVASSAKIYIDFNHNASFTDPGEEIYSNTSIPSVLPSAVISGSFTAPGSALTGCTKMRVIMMSSWIGTITPTGTYGFGETEDYSINIIQASASDPAISAINVPTGTCFTNNETVTATLCNYGSGTINLGTNNVIVTLLVTGPTGVTSYPVPVTSGTLTPYAGACLPVTFTGVNLYPGGNYSINTSLSISGLGNGSLQDDSLALPITRSNYRPTGGPNYQLCQGSIIPFGQGLTVSGCATPVNDSVTITFTLAPGQPPMCPNTSTNYLGSCLFASAPLPVLPAGASFVGNGLLTITNLFTDPANPNNTWAQEQRFSLFRGNVPLTAATTFIPGGIGNPGFSIPTGFTYTNSTTITPTVLGNIYSALGAGGILNIGQWDTYSTPTTVNINAGGNPTQAKLKFYYTYVPASFEWYNVPTGGSVLYTYSPFNPIGVTGSGVPNSNTPGTTPFYASCAGSSNCRVQVNLVINPVPVVVQDTLTFCEYAVGSNSAAFNLSLLNGPVSAFNPLTSVSYFGDQALFLPITSPTNDTSSTNFIYSQVTYTATGCFSSDSVLLDVNPIPQFVSNPLVGNACAPNAVDVASLINPFTTSAGADTLYFSDPGCTIPHPNPHAIFTPDTVYMVLVTNTVPYCSDTTSAYIDIIPATNYIVSQDIIGNFSNCGTVGCANLIMGDGNTETLYTTTDCRKVATVTDLTNGTSLGSTSICEDIDCSVQFHNGQPYVNRHYQITPSNNDSAQVCLYYLQQDFDDYNAAAFGTWPLMDPVTNLCITQVDNGDLNTPGHTAISIPNSAITSTYDPLTTVWSVCFKVDSFSYFYCATCNPLNIALPVTLTDFKGRRLQSASELTWLTSGELNNSHFIVERSKDLKGFIPISEKIKSKAPGGNSQISLSYSFIDKSPFNGHNYYRLRQVDIDQHISHSNVVDVYIGNETMVTLYPNPVNDELNIEINASEAGKAIATLMDGTGRVVRTIEMILQSGVNYNKVDMRSLSDGTYLIKITDPKGLNYTQTIRKK